MRTNPLIIGVAGAIAIFAFVAAGFIAGHATVTPKPPFPSNEQLTIAAAALVHGLEVQQDFYLAAPPDFTACHDVAKPVGGIGCDFHVTYVDGMGAAWETVLDAKNEPALIRKLKVAHPSASPE